MSATAGRLHLADPGLPSGRPDLGRDLHLVAPDAANPFYRANDTKPSAGADLKYGLPGGLTLTASVNPDFGQVEVDPAVVNLSAYETFFPEKRPFFVEGANIFNIGSINGGPSYGNQQIFYSRRIGRPPQRFVQACPGHPSHDGTCAHPRAD